MSRRLNPSLSRHATSAINDFVQHSEAPWTCWHTRLPWYSQSYTFPTGWSTASDESSAQSEDELCARINVLSLTPVLNDCLPAETSDSFEQYLGGFGQDFAGSIATDLTRCLSPPSKDTGHATRSKVSPSAKSLGEICESGETLTAVAPEVRYLACPFSKHDPARYERVWNVCTARPGCNEVKRVLEHLNIVHSRKKRCERCRVRYPKQNELETHISKNNCTKVEETDPSRPELMTAEQEGIFEMTFNAMTPENKWRAYYQFLFPDAPNRHSINPYYNYTTLTHRLDPFASGLARADALEPEVRYLACPFSKHDPARYERVYNSCTTIPGWEGVKRALEHLNKVHSRKKRCERCRVRYPKQNELENHISKNNCTKVEETDPFRPEIMTAEQEKIFGMTFDAMNSEDKWRAYYQFLFPDAPNLHPIDPYYDYNTLTHRLDSFAAVLTTQKRSASPPSNPDDCPQSKRKSRGVPANIPQVDSFVAQCSDNYEYRSGDIETPSVNQNLGDVKIGTSKCTDNASQSTNLDSAYGSIIPSSSQSPAPMVSTSAPPKFDRDDSAIALSSNASVLIDPPATQSQSGHAVQDHSSPIPPPYPSKIDPDLPSNVITPDQKRYLGFDLEDHLDPSILMDFDFY